ncbi:MAG: hypothetical protein HYY93_09965 [Planctomycetes bacterium]|nr:hypothetical protein [Planctomycetota bacterium]
MERVAFADLFRNFFGTLEACRTTYLAYGGVAVGVWGDPRETQDVDAVVSAPEEECPILLGEFARAGFAPGLRAGQTLPIDGWTRRRWGGRYAEVSLGRTPFDRSAMERRRRVTLFGMAIRVATAEDLLLYKLTAYRYKDLADAQAVCSRQKPLLDLAYLRHWASEIAAPTGKFEVPSKLEELVLGRP